MAKHGKASPIELGQEDDAEKGPPVDWNERRARGGWGGQYSHVPALVCNAMATGQLPDSALKLAVALGQFMTSRNGAYPSIRTLMGAAHIRDWRTFDNARAALRDHCGLRWRADPQHLGFTYSWPPYNRAVSVMATDLTSKY